MALLGNEKLFKNINELNLPIQQALEFLAKEKFKYMDAVLVIRSCFKLSLAEAKKKVAANLFWEKDVINQEQLTNSFLDAFEDKEIDEWYKWL